MEWPDFEVKPLKKSDKPYADLMNELMKKLPDNTKEEIMQHIEEEVKRLKKDLWDSLLKE